ncbi:MAG: hypothetical protein ACW976_01460 [Candidatus Ranarchaeia archaeon]
MFVRRTLGIPREWEDEDDLLELIKEKYYVKESPSSNPTKPPPSVKKSVLTAAVDVYFQVFLFLTPWLVLLWPIIFASPLLMFIIGGNVLLIGALKVIEVRE